MQMLQKFENKYFKVSLKNSLLFIPLLLAILLSIFMLSVIIFYNWIAVIIDKLNLSGWVNTFTVLISLAVLFLVVSYFTIITFKYLIKTPNNFIRIFVSLIVIVSAFFSIGILLNPAVISKSASKQLITVNQASFIFYNYPEKDQVEKIKQNDFEAIISLLNPKLFPFEGNMLKRELGNAHYYKVKVIEINNLLPWDTGRKKEIKSIIDSIRNTKGKYYVHSYLGNNRIEVFKDLLLSKINKLPKGLKQTNIALENGKKMERGEVIKLADELFFTPYPNDSEFKNIIFPSGIKSIVCLLNDNNPSDTGWINKEKKLCRDNSVRLFLKPVTIYPYDAGGVFETTLFVRALPKPVIVHAINSNSLISEAFIETFKHEKRAFPPSMFYGRMKNGKPNLILPNVVVGPKPTLEEYSSYIVEKGIRGLIYCGPQNKVLGPFDKAFFKKLGLSWEKVPLDELAAKKEIKLGGMWYIYGADSLAVKKRLTE